MSDLNQELNDMIDFETLTLIADRLNVAHTVINEEKLDKAIEILKSTSSIEVMDLLEDAVIEVNRTHGTIIVKPHGVKTNKKPLDLMNEIIAQAEQ